MTAFTKTQKVQDLRGNVGYVLEQQETTVWVVINGTTKVYHVTKIFAV